MPTLSRRYIYILFSYQRLIKNFFSKSLNSRQTFCCCDSLLYTSPKFCGFLEWFPLLLKLDILCQSLFWECCSIFLIDPFYFSDEDALSKEETVMPYLNVLSEFREEVRKIAKKNNMNEILQVRGWQYFRSLHVFSFLINCGMNCCRTWVFV